MKLTKRGNEMNRLASKMSGYESIQRMDGETQQLFHKSLRELRERVKALENAALRGERDEAGFMMDAQAEQIQQMTQYALDLEQQLAALQPKIRRYHVQSTVDRANKHNLVSLLHDGYRIADRVFEQGQMDAGDLAEAIEELTEIANLHAAHADAEAIIEVV